MPLVLCLQLCSINPAGERTGIVDFAPDTSVSGHYLLLV
jgi:hypothetical protein